MRGRMRHALIPKAIVIGSGAGAATTDSHSVRCFRQVAYRFFVENFNRTHRIQPLVVGFQVGIRADDVLARVAIAVPVRFGLHLSLSNRMTKPAFARVVGVVCSRAGKVTCVVIGGATLRTAARRRR